MPPCPSANWESKSVTWQLAKLEEAGLIDRRSMAGESLALVRVGEVRQAMILIAARVMVGLGALGEALVHVMDLHKRVTERLRELPL